MSTAYLLRLPSGEEFGPAPIADIATWAKDGRVPLGAKLIGPQGGVSDASVHAELAPHLVRSAVSVQPTGPVSTGAPASGIDRLIPTGNPASLISYYTGIIGALFAVLLGPIGAIAGVVAIIYGVKALKVAKAEPARHGKTHAWVGLIAGAFCVLFGSLYTLVVIVALAGGFK